VFGEKGLAMGILDSLENSPAFRSALGQLGAAVVPVVLSEVLGNGSQGGLNAIVAKLEQAGFGDQVKSWIGNGHNLPITAEQLQQVLGSDIVKQLAARFNIPVDQLARILAEQLPTAVDHASPGRQAPAHRLRQGQSPGRAGRSGLEPENTFIALKYLQNPRACHVPMCWPM
jgi:uncharacterized protein YidB (DUF937 family)